MLKYRNIIIPLILVLLSVSAVFAEDGKIAVFVGGVPIPEALIEKRAKSESAISSAAMTEEEKTAALEAANRKALLDLITEQACLNEAERLGLDREGPVTEETDRLYGKMIGAVENYVRVSYPNLDQTAMDEEVDGLLRVLGETRESYREMAFRSAMISALEAYWLANMPEPSDEEIQQYYNGLYSAQKELFDADENEFESAMLNGKPVVYRPRDLKLIRKAEFLFSDDVTAFLRRARQLGISNNDPQIMDRYHALADEVEPIYEALLSGEISFTEVMEGLKEGSSLQVNYFHPDSTRFSKDYHDRAAAFSKIGEISTAYLLPNGYAVLEYFGDIPAGELTLAESSEMIRELIREEDSKEYLTKMKQDLLDKSDVRFVTDEQ